MRQKERQTHYDSTYRDSIASRGKMPSFEDLSQTTFGEYSFLPAAPRMEFSTYMAPKYYIAATVSMQAKDALLLCVNYGVTSLIMWKDRQTDTRPTLYTFCYGCSQRNNRVSTNPADFREISRIHFLKIPDDFYVTSHTISKCR